LSCLICATGWANAPRWGGRLRCWLAAPLPLPQQWTCSAVQIVTRGLPLLASAHFQRDKTAHKVQTIWAIAHVLH
jgi:hypothetical protein